MKHMINYSNFSAGELAGILSLALDMKAKPEKYTHALEGRKLYTLFEKTSTRTFLSFTAGKHATVPFINGCDNSFHPCQILADAMTLIEKFGSLDVKLLYVGAKNNVFNSLVEFFAKMGRGRLYGFTPLVNNTACGEDFYRAAADTDYYIELDPRLSPAALRDIARDMDAVYTDTWIDMEFFNDPAYGEKKREVLSKMLPYQVNEALLTGSRAIVLHDMPIHAGYEISQETMEKNIEHILDQAENRRHTEKALMYTLLKGECNGKTL